jgi:hypothetical protein
MADNRTFKPCHCYLSCLIVTIILVFFVVSCASVGTNKKKTDHSNVDKPVEQEWQQSYQAGYMDSSGYYAGGSEILHLVGHKAKLYAANGYWMDSRNIWYGGTDRNTGWAQILRLDSYGGKWEVDLEMGPRHLRSEILKRVTFTTDKTGKILDEPVNILIACANSQRPGGSAITFFVRNDKTGNWVRTKILSNLRQKGESVSVRDMHVYRDKVTGIDRIFVTIGILGIFSGVYDPDQPGGIKWNQESESSPVKIRPLAIIEANSSLLFSSGKYIYRRNDGQKPTYDIIQDLSDIFPGKIKSAVGGIRGLTALPNPAGAGDSLLFVLGEGGRSRGCIYRLDPDGKGGYAREQEICLDSVISKYLDGNPVYYVLAAYNDILAVVDPTTRETVHIIGLEAWIGGHRFPIPKNQSKPAGGFYSGAMYAIRDHHGNYRLNEVNGPAGASKLDLVAPRAYTISPFKNHDKKVIYFGGYDCNYFPSKDTAWVFSTSIKNALRKDVPKAVERD